VQGDMAMRFIDGASDHSQGLTLHSYFRTSEVNAIGVFAGKDWYEGNGVSHYGLETAGTMNAISYDAAYTHVDGRGDGDIFSLRGAYAVNDRLAAGLRADNFNGGGENLRRLGGTVSFATASGLNLSGELGMVDITEHSAESYIGLGVKKTFGAKGGSTFAKRGYIDILPGN
jgi:hypothetical protein